MKLRIKENSLRIRLTKTEVGKLAETGYLEEQTIFTNNRLVYTLQRKDDITDLSAIFENNTITIFVPASFLGNWPANNVVGMDSKMPLPDDSSLYLLLEKDFVCLDDSTEDQSDNYENPGKTC